MKKLLFLLLLTPLLVTSQIPEPEKGTYVNDQYGYLNDNQKSIINKQLRYIEDSTGVQVAIILIPTVPDKYSIEEYANQIGRKWHVGNAKNGIVYVAAIDQRKQRMEVASHLEGIITDAVAAHIISNTKPFFRAQKYGEGIINMVLSLQIKLLEAKKEQLQLTADELKKKKNTSWINWLGWLLIWISTFAISTVIFKTIRRRREQRLRKEQEELIRRTNQQLAIEKRSYEMAQHGLQQHMNNKYKQSIPATRSNIISDDPALIIPPPPETYTLPSKSYDEDNYSSGSGGYSSGSSDSGSSSSSSSSDYGNWGSGSSDSGSSSSDSGYSGGGASDSW